MAKPGSDRLGEQLKEETKPGLSFCPLSIPWMLIPGCLGASLGTAELLLSLRNSWNLHPGMLLDGPATMSRMRVQNPKTKPALAEPWAPKQPHKAPLTLYNILEAK